MRKRFIKQVTIVLSKAALAASSASASEMCWRQAEIDAAKVRNMQTVLMVAALECGNTGFAADRAYNDFVAQNRGSLHGYNDSLREYFQRAYGEVEGRRTYDRFTTALANRQSRSALDSGNFCRNAEMLGRLAVDSDQRGVLALASDIEERPYGVGMSCDEAVEQAPRVAYTEATLPDRLPEPPFGNSRPVSVAIPDPVAVPEAIPAVAIAPPVAASVVRPAAIAVADAPVPVAAPVIMSAVAVAPPPAAEPTAAPVAVARPVQVAARSDPAAALVAAAEALKLAAEAMRDANAAPADAAPVIRERVHARKL